MEHVIDFKCTGENLEQIPDEIISRTGISFPEAHQNKNLMACLAVEMKKFKHDSFVRIPFCVTVEAEALGAKIKLGNSTSGPRVEEYAFTSMDELKNVEVMDLTKGRIKEVLDCVELLHNQQEIAALSVEGPFTIISSLMDPMIFFKAIRQRPEEVKQLLTVIEESIIRYIEAGVERGAMIISYGDPVGSMDIVGPKLYREYSGKTSYNILKKLESLPVPALIHLCGKTSTALEKLGLSETKSIEVDKDISYGQALCNLLKDLQEIRFIGHRCIKWSPNKMGKQVVWEIALK